MEYTDALERNLLEVMKVITADYKPEVDDKPFVIPSHDKKRKPLSWDEFQQWLKIHNA